MIKRGDAFGSRQGRSEWARHFQELGHELTGKAKEKLEELRDSVTRVYEEGRQKTREWREALEDSVREEPWRALLLSAGVGLAVGILIASWSGRERRRLPRRPSWEGD